VGNPDLRDRHHGDRFSPWAYYSARYNIDLDLVTRGSGFGYYGSVVTNVIFATFTFIFFALEGSIMAQGLQLGLGIPLWIGYATSTIIIFPLVIYGMKVLSTLQVWTTPPVAGPDGGTVRLPGGQPSGVGQLVLRVQGRKRRSGIRHRLDGCWPPGCAFR